MSSLTNNFPLSPSCAYLSNTSTKNTFGESPFEEGDIAWTLTCSAMVWLMVPGIGFFYSGMARSRSALSLIILCCWSIAVVSIQWFILGYSLTFSENGNVFIGNLDKMLLWGVSEGRMACNCKVPEIVCCIYHGMIAGLVPALVVGSIAERGRFLPTVVFMFIWTTFVYDIVAHQVWNIEGWGNILGGLDFAGGTPVHITSGAAAIAYAMLLGEREGRSAMVEYKPHNLVQVILGTSLMWFGWFGFNAGNALGANARAGMVIVVTNLSASIGGITWALLDYKKTNTFSAISFCFGSVAGLVCVTPASGFIRPAAAPVFGILGAVCCKFAKSMTVMIDDALDVVNVHLIGGLVGTLLTGIFAEKEIAALDGVTIIEGGWINGNFHQILYQIADCVAGGVWAFVVTYLILFGMNKIPGLKLRVDATTARLGLDKKELGENAYEKLAGSDGP